MKKRCFNPRSKDYADYGGRGITVCDEWKDDFAAFMAHIGPRPSPVHSVDRIRNSEGYRPGNVKWSTRTEQSRNRRSSHLVEFRGETKTLAEWAEIVGIKASRIHKRIEIGWSVEDAMSTPVDPNRTGKARSIQFRDKQQSIVAWAKEFGMSAELLRYRLESGWSMARIAVTPVNPYRRPRGVGE